jgi:LmbE family N-acetylglucosaminyl deacetylase
VAVVSPHLDDAVLACSRLLASRPGSTVITLFAGGRADWGTVSDWDRICGFTPGQDVTAVRREEDRGALGLLRAVPIWLDAPENEYRTGAPDATEWVPLLAAELDPFADRDVLIPLGLHHPDHLLAHRLATAAMEAIGRRSWYLYGDFYHVTLPHLVEPRLAELTAAGDHTEETTLEQGSIRAKRRAIKEYRTQRRGLSMNVHRWGARAEERFWRVQR